MSLTLGIIVALPAEASALTRHPPTLQFPVEIANNIKLIISGMGANAAERAAQQLITQGTNALFSFGTAAGINPTCKAGDIIIANTCLDSQNLAWQVDQHWRQNLCDVLSQNKSINVITDSILESTKVLSNHDEKKTLFKSSGAVAVDMESAALARIAQTHGLPFLSLRAIVDNIDSHIPSAVNQAMDKHGNVNTRKLLNRLIKKPGDIMPLIQLAINFYLAKKALVTCRKLAGPGFAMAV